MRRGPLHAGKAAAGPSRSDVGVDSLGGISDWSWVFCNPIIQNKRRRAAHRRQLMVWASDPL